MKRRTFLGLGAAALASSSALAVPVNRPQKFDESYDVVIIGAGGAGLAAATEAVVLHSDQGTLYTHSAFRRAAEDLLVKQSYSRKGNCWDNAVMEGWNGTLKTEWLYHPDNRYHKNLLTADEAKLKILEYCNYYNEERIQAKLNYRSPKQYREAVVRQA